MYLVLGKKITERKFDPVTLRLDHSNRANLIIPTSPVVALRCWPRIKTYHDHRMAMCFATLGLAVPGLKIEDPSCVRKTVPSFFQILAAPPPKDRCANCKKERSQAFLQVPVTTA